MFKILTLNTISPTGLQQFPRDQYEIAGDIPAPDAILVRSQAMQEMTIAPSVKAIGRAGAGVNNIPVDAMTRLGIPVFNTPGANANAVRELVLAGMLLASRHICAAWRYVNQLTTTDSALDKQIEQDKKQFVGTELLGKTIGVIGLGSVGVKVANAAIHLGMRVIGFDPTITVNRAWELSSDVQQARTIEEVLKVADYVTIHVPLNDETRHLINGPRLALLKPTAVLLNFARDGIIEKPALLAALQANQLAAYVNDFPDANLKDHPRVISLPHLGASTAEAEENCAVMIVKEIRDFLENGTIVNSVNFPNLDVPPLNTGTRLLIANANIPNMVAQISTKLGVAHLNIRSLSNKSRDSIAYTVVDVEGGVSETLLAEIRHIEGVIQARALAARV